MQSFAQHLKHGSKVKIKKQHLSDQLTFELYTHKKASCDVAVKVFFDHGKGRGVLPRCLNFFRQINFLFTFKPATDDTSWNKYVALEG